MKIKKQAMAGTLESSDVLIKVSDADSLIISIESPVLAQFGEQIETVIRNVLNEQKIEKAHIEVIDHGALDCTIEARLLTAIARSQED